MLNIENTFTPPPDDLFKTIPLDVDYFEGDWKSCIVFFKNCVNLDLFESNLDYWYSVVKLLQRLNSTGASLEKFSANTKVLPHTDKDLINSREIVRIFYPLQKDEFYFKGYVEENGKVVHKEFKTNSPVIFNPNQEHSFECYKDGYYLIIDITADVTKLDREFWKNYLSFGAIHYLSL